MHKHSHVLAAGLVSILLVGASPGCSDDTTKSDAAVTDKGSAGPLDNGAPPDRAARDSKPAVDKKVKPDGKATQDLKAKPDTSPPKDKGTPPPKDKGTPPDKAAKVDAWAASCPGVTCKIQDDCCVCKSRKGGITWPACPITTCKQNTCGSVYIKKPAPYCLKGHCLLTDTGTACKIDSDCKLVNNCCDCLALPKGSGPPPCKITTCLVPTCQGKGLTAAKPRCLGGVCYLRIP